MKKKYGILAYPAGHSLSPVMHNAGFKKLGIDAEYVLFERKPEELAAFVTEVRSEGIAGFSVSIPHKESIIAYLDQIDDDAFNIGAVNTVVNRDGVLHGYNTDWIGSNQALSEGFINLGQDGEMKGKIAVVLGAGGSARAVAYGLLKEGVHVWIKNRNKAKADAIAIEFAELFKTEIHSVPLDDMGTGDILVNTTSAWLNYELSEELPVGGVFDYCDPVYLKAYQLVMDLIYKPFNTPLIDAAAEANIECVTGENMLLYQGVKQFELWTGEKAPVEVMRGALEKAL